MTGPDPVTAVTCHHEGIDAYCAVPDDLAERWRCILREVPADLESKVKAIVDEEEDPVEAAGRVEALMAGREDVAEHTVDCMYSKREFKASLASGLKAPPARPRGDRMSASDIRAIFRAVPKNLSAFLSVGC